MGLALYIAVGSLLDGPGSRIFPDSLVGTLWLTGVVHIVGLLILVWLGAVLLSNRFENRSQPFSVKVTQFRND